MKDKYGLEFHSGDLAIFEESLGGETIENEVYVVAAYRNELYVELNRPRMAGQGFWLHKKNKLTKLTKEIMLLRKLES